MKVETQANPADAIMFHDYETSGMPVWGSPSEGDDQPHIVEVAALLYTRQGVLLDKFVLVVRPNGWVISDEVVAIHGITQEYATECGIDEKVAIAMLLNMHARCSVRVAHNRAFDDRITRIAIMRHLPEVDADAYKAAPGECTALLTKPLCKLPATEKMKATNFKNSFKTPSVAEAFAFFTGKQMEEAHRAMPDAQATARVYFAMKGIRMPEFPDDLPHDNATEAPQGEPVEA